MSPSSFLSKCNFSLIFSRFDSHARDNHIHLFHLPPPPASSLLSLQKAPSPSSPSPKLDPIWSIQVNALNFCQLSLLLLPYPSAPLLLEKGKLRASEEEEEEPGLEALIAVPSLTKDDFVRFLLTFCQSSEEELIAGKRG